MSTQRLIYIDVFKAVAIFAVVLYHAGLLSYGYLGVDILLVLSGLFVTKSLEGKGYFSFISGRIMRLLPVLLIAGLVAMVVGWFTMLPDDYENLAESVVATNLFGNNILAAITTGDYWSLANEYKPLMHTWYVGLLMQFCLVYPLLFYFAKLEKKMPRRTLIVLISSLALLSLLFFLQAIMKRIGSIIYRQGSLSLRLAVLLLWSMIRRGISPSIRYFHIYAMHYC